MTELPRSVNADPGLAEYLRACSRVILDTLAKRVAQTVGKALITFAVGYLVTGVVQNSADAKAPVVAVDAWKLAFGLSFLVLGEVVLSSYRLWRQDQARIATLSGEKQNAIDARDAAVAAAVAASARAEAVPTQQPSEVDLVLRELERLKCPGPKGFTGADFFYFAFPEVQMKRGRLSHLAFLANVPWSYEKREPLRVEFEQFMQALVREELLKPAELQDVPWSEGKLGAEVWKRLREQRRASGAVL